MPNFVDVAIVGAGPYGLSLAAHLSAPDKASTLEAWCAANGKDYSAQKTPVALDDFVAYADWFTRTYVPTLEQKNVTDIVRGADFYTLTLENGARLEATRVVMAVGISRFKNLP